MSKPLARRRAASTLLLRPIALLRFLFDRRSPWLPRAIALMSVVYVILPWDLIPDLVPIVGWLDDVGFVTFALGFVARSAARHEDQRALALDSARTPSSP